MPLSGHLINDGSDQQRLIHLQRYVYRGECRNLSPRYWIKIPMSTWKEQYINAMSKSSNCRKSYTRSCQEMSLHSRKP